MAAAASRPKSEVNANLPDHSFFKIKLRIAKLRETRSESLEILIAGIEKKKQQKKNSRNLSLQISFYIKARVRKGEKYNNKIFFNLFLEGLIRINENLFYGLHQQAYPQKKFNETPS